MPDLWLDVDTEIQECPVNILPLTDDTDFKSRETAVAYNATGMDLVWNFITCAGAFTQTAVTPATGSPPTDYAWVNQGDGMYTIDIPASGGATINNDTEGFGWFSGVATGVLPWRGPTIGFRAAGLNDKIVESAYSTTRGLAGTALPDAAAEASGGLFTRGTGAGQINQDSNGRIDTNVAAISADSTAADNCELMFDGTGYAGGTTKLKVDLETIKTQAVTCAGGVTVPAATLASTTNITAASGVTLTATTGLGNQTANITGTITTATNLTNAPPDSSGVTTLLSRIVGTLAAGTHNAQTGDSYAIVNSGTYGNSALKTLIDTIDDFLDTEIAAILADTNELQTDWVNGGRLDLLIDAIKAKTDTIPASPAAVGSAMTLANDSVTAAAIAADAVTEIQSGLATAEELAKVPKSDSNVTWNATALASVKAEVVGALNTDTYAEPGQGNPPATASIVQKLGYMYKNWRNKKTQTSSEWALYADDGTTKDQEAAVSDDGTTTTKGEIGTGA